MDFLLELKKTARGQAVDTIELMQMHESQVEEILQTYNSQFENIPFEKLFLFLNLCLYIIGSKRRITRADSNITSIIKEWIPKGIDIAKIHPNSNKLRMEDFYNACVTRDVIPQKKLADIIEDESEPWKRRIEAMVEDLKRSEPESRSELTLEVDDAGLFNVSIKRLKM